MQTWIYLDLDLEGSRSTDLESVPWPLQVQSPAEEPTAGRRLPRRPDAKRGGGERQAEDQAVDKVTAAASKVWIKCERWVGGR